MRPLTNEEQAAWTALVGVADERSPEELAGVLAAALGQLTGEQIAALAAALMDKATAGAEALARALLEAAKAEILARVMVGLTPEQRAHLLAALADLQENAER